MDPVAVVQGALAPLQRARDAIQGVTDLKTTLRQRYGDYTSIIESLKSKPDVIAATESEREVLRLTELFTRVADLIGEYTAAPGDSKAKKANITAKRAADYEKANKELDEIDADVMRQLGIMNLKGTLSSSEMEVLQGLDDKEERPTSLVDDTRPPTLPDMAAVPAGALSLPHGYVERVAVQDVANGLTITEEPCTPYAVVGMGGGGKSVLASAVVRMLSVRKYFRGGIFWMTVGRGAKNSILPFLQGLVREMGATSEHGVPRVFDSHGQVQQHLISVLSTGTSPRLLVLDDVWEQEVVDELVLLGLKLLVTTRDRSVIGVLYTWRLLDLGDMREEEALELLLTTSMTVGQPGDDVRAQMTKVIRLCGHLPLVLAIAGSIPVVKGKDLTAGSWAKLIEELENVTTEMKTCDEGSGSLNAVLEISLNALTIKKKREIKKTAVLAPGAVASTEMLLNLWETEDMGGTREEAESLVSKCLLQELDGGGYRVHDLVLEFVKLSIKADVGMMERATALQAHYLGRLPVVKSYRNPEHGAGSQDLLVLDTLWRSVENLSGDLGLEVASYRTSLGELESAEATADVASSLSSVGFLFNVQGKFAEAGALFDRSRAIQEQVFGPEHPDVASSLNNRAGSLGSQGNYAAADRLYERSQAIREKVLGPEHPDVAIVLDNRARLWWNQGNYAAANRLYERSQAIREKVLGPEHPDVAVVLHDRTCLLESQGKYEEAAPLYKRLLAFDEKVYGPDHPEVAADLGNWAFLLKKQGMYAEAQSLFERSQTIREKVFGPGHPAVAKSLHNRAALLGGQGKHSEAEPLYGRLAEILETTLGSEHPSLAVVLNDWAKVLADQGKYEEAGALHQRSLAIREKDQDPNHIGVAQSLNNRGIMLSDQGKYREAIPLVERALSILMKKLGANHPFTVGTQTNLKIVRHKASSRRNWGTSQR